MRYISPMIAFFVVTLACSAALACLEGNTPEDLAKRQRAMFDQIDAQHDNRITFDEWVHSARGKLDVEDLSSKNHQQMPPPCKTDTRACEDQARSIFHEMDKNGDGTLTFEEWAVFHPLSGGMFLTDCM